MKEYISNISFVIITLNEEFGIKKCLSSILKLQMKNCEIIFIDSNSQDKTISVIESFSAKFEETKLFKISGKVNAAIARNVGIKNASKKIIFFIDGDIEIKTDFLIKSQSLLKNGFCDAVTGNLEEYQYSDNYNEIITIVKRIRSNKDRFIYFCGGNFLINRKAILKNNLFNETFPINEDVDFTLNFTQSNKLYCINQIMGIHHTIPYFNIKRIKDQYLNCIPMFSGSVIRRNIFNLKGLFSLFKSNSYYYWGFSFIASLFIALIIKSKEMLLMLSLIIILDVFIGAIKKQSMLYRMLTHYIYPVFVIIGLGYFPKKKQKYYIKKIE